MFSLNIFSYITAFTTNHASSLYIFSVSAFTSKLLFKHEKERHNNALNFYLMLNGTIVAGIAPSIINVGSP